MNPDQKELTLEESVKQVMQTLPPIVRDYVKQGKYTEVAKILMMKYDLHIDQGTILERELMLLVMGIESPTEFMQSLSVEALLDDKTVDGIIIDVNDLIFIPLREEEMKGGVAKAPAPPVAWKASVALATKPAPVIAGVPSYEYAKPKQSSPQFFHLENKIAAPPPAPKPIIPEVRPSPEFPPASPEATQGTARVEPQMQLAEKRGQTSLPSVSSTKMLEDREEPHIALSGSEASTKQDELKKVLQQVVPSQIAPLRMAEVRQINKAEVPPNLPGVVQPVIPEVRPSPEFPKVEPPTPLAKQYVADPYREPVEL